MSNTKRGRHNEGKPRPIVRPYKRMQRQELARFVPPIYGPRCFAGSKPKVCYSWHDAEARRLTQQAEGLPMRVYPCGPHWHLTSKV